MEARNFDPAATYSSGDLCLYKGYLYKFTSPHTGEWNSADVSLYDTVSINEIIEMITGDENYSVEAAYAATIVFDVEQIRETRYAYVFTNAADPRENSPVTPGQ